jgi:hypothetical protein
MYNISNLTRKSMHAYFACSLLSSICTKTTDEVIIKLTKCNMYMNDVLEPGTSLINMLKKKISHKPADIIFNGMLRCHQNSAG